MDESATARLKLCGSANSVKGTQLSNSQIESNLLSKNWRVRVPSFTAKTGAGEGDLGLKVDEVKIFNQ